MKTELSWLSTRTGSDDVDIVAHSKGGLDARQAIENSTIARNLVMLGTPNGGTVLADLACGLVNVPGFGPEKIAVRAAAREVTNRWFASCEDMKGATWDLSEFVVRGPFNRTVQDNPNVVYQTIAGASSCGLCRALGPLLGDNDILVSVESAEWLAERGHISAGVFDAHHEQLFTRENIAERVYCSLTGRGQRWSGCDVTASQSEAASPSTTAAVAAPPGGLVHSDAVQIPAGGTKAITLPVAGIGTAGIGILADRTGLGATAPGVSFTVEDLALAAQVTSSTNVTVTVSNPTSTAANALVLVSGSGQAAVPLDLRLQPDVVPSGQAATVAIHNAPGGPADPTAGLTGAIESPDGSTTPLSFIAFGTAAVAFFTPTVPGEYGVVVEHAGSARRVASRQLNSSTGGATLTGAFSESTSAGSDGLVDALHIDVGTTVNQADSYTVSAGLAAADGTILATAETRASLVAGSAPVRLTFRGPALYAAATNGPYHLVDITLTRRTYDWRDSLESRQASGPPTQSYQATAFRPADLVPGWASVTEGNSGTVEMAFPVTLSERVNVPVTVIYAAIEPSHGASWPEDFDPVLGGLTFQPGETTKTITLTIKGDTLDEVDETAFVQFYQPTGVRLGGIGVGGVTILDDDPPPVIEPGFATATTEGNSGTKVVQIPFTLSAPSGRVVTVNYAPTTQSGQAVFPGDFTAPTGTLTFQPGETTKTVPLTIKGDTLNEADENALIALTQPTNATIGGFGVGGVTILDDD